MAASQEDWNSRLQAAGCIDSQGEVLNRPAYDLFREMAGEVTDLRREAAGLREDYDNLTQDIAAKRRKIKRLQSDEDKDMRHDPMYQTALAVLQHWRDLCHPKARELGGGERMRKVLARLHGDYTEEQLKRCAWGYSQFAFVVEGRRMQHGSPGRRYIDAELIFRDPKHVDQGIALADEADRREAVLPEDVPPTKGNGSGHLSPLGEAAVKFAAFGWYVFPCIAQGKQPNTKHGLLDATRDEVRIAKWWGAHPDDNIGVRCGVESEIMVLDVDGDAGFESLRELEMAYEELPNTLRIKTPRGGNHFYFRHPGGEVHNTSGFPGFGLDVRGDGGYALVPPSVGPAGEYVLDERTSIMAAPVWLVGMLRKHRLAMASMNAEQWVDAIMRDIPAGGRNGALTSITGKFLSLGNPPEFVYSMVWAQNVAHCHPPLATKEVKTIVDSIVGRDARRRQEASDGQVSN